MPLEIERKFIVRNDIWDMIKRTDPVLMHQGYLFITEQTTIGVRYSDKKGTKMIKGKQQGISRDEYEIPLDEVM